MTSKEKAKELYDEFGKLAERVTEEIIGALYDWGIREPKDWYDVQEELNKLKNSNL